MVKYIVGGVIVVLSWALAIIIEFPFIYPTLLTLLVGLVLLLLVGLEKLRERRSARELERALSAQAAQQVASTRPDLQHEIAEMNAEFQKAIAALKKSKKGGKKALYALPWYTIIGPSGCGKSTALRNSGLDFPYLSASGGGVRGLGGTRNCDWWMTSEGVILDTAGRWSSQDEDRDEWLAFLDLIKRFRPKKPLNGIIVAASVGDLGGCREEDAVALARQIRERIDEVQGRLSMSLPVYVLFTKCDLIPGFIETFGEMTREERSQIWGFTAPLRKPIGPVNEFFAAHFDRLVALLEQRSLRRMGEERKIASREMIYAFPQQMAVLRQNLQEFVHHLFLENVFKETPRLRGVYFASGTQEGRPIDRVMSRMAEAFGQPQVLLPEPQVDPKSYFLRDMFAHVVFKDADVAVRSPEELKRQRRSTMLAAAGISLFALGISGLPAISWLNNRQLLDETREIVDEAREAVAGEVLSAIEPARIERLREQAMKLEEYDSGPPLFFSMGMYPDGVYAPLRSMYLAILQRNVLGPIVRADGAEMEAFGRRFESGARPDAQELRAMYERLKLHLLLTEPRDEVVAEPTRIDEEHASFLRGMLVRRWQDATETRRADPAYAQIEQNVDYFVRRFAGGDKLTFARDFSAVGRVRGVFNAVGGFDMAMEGIIEEVRPRGADITLQRLLGREVTTLTNRERVRFAFTRDGYERHVAAMLDTEAARFFGEPWVLGHPPPEDERRAEQERACQVEALKSYYLNRYVEEWRRFIDGIAVNVPHTDEEALILLTQLTGGEPMRLTMLVRQIDREVTLDAPSGGGTSMAGAAAGAAAREAKQALQKRLGTRMGEGNTRRLMEAAEADARRRLTRSCPPIPNRLEPSGVRQRFVGFLDFAPAPARDVPEGQAAQITPARRYEEQLEFLRDALQFRLSGTHVTDYEQRKQIARELTEQLILDRPPEWRERFGTLLLPPIEGAVPPPAEEESPEATPAAAPDSPPSSAARPRRPRSRSARQPLQPVVRPF